jgi:hypothetical protein
VKKSSRTAAVGVKVKVEETGLGVAVEGGVFVTGCEVGVAAPEQAVKRLAPINRIVIIFLVMQ